MGFWDTLFPPKQPTQAQKTQSAPRKGLLRSWATCQIAPTDYVVLDLETAGLDACVCDILEVGIIRYRDYTEVARYHTMVQPQGRIDPKASAVNGITWAKVCRAPLFNDVSEAIFAFIGEDTIVGYNIEFDIKFLQTRAQRQLENDLFDVLRLARQVMPGRSSYKLDSFREDFHLGGDAHTALGDCSATQSLMTRCIALPAYIEFQSRLAAENALQAERARQIADEREAQKKIRSEYRDRINSALPSTSQLKQISKDMDKDVLMYAMAVDNILKEHDLKIIFKKGALTMLPDHRMPYYRKFFFVKTSGQLCYIGLNIPPDSIQCRFPIGATTDGEFLNGSRIYVAKYHDLYELSEYVIQAYQNAQINS